MPEELKGETADFLTKNMHLVTKISLLTREQENSQCVANLKKYIKWEPGNNSLTSVLGNLEGIDIETKFSKILKNKPC